MAGDSPESSSFSTPVVIYPKIKAFQERLYPALYGQLWQKGLAGDEADRIYAETLGRQTVNRAAADAQQGLGNTLASQGVSLKSPVYAGLSRGIAENQITNLLAASEQAARAKQAGKAGYMQLLNNYATSYPPVGQTSNTQQSGGGGK